MNRKNRLAGIAACVLPLIAAVLPVVVIQAPVSADTAARDGLPESLAADALPTPQINGVVWATELTPDIAFIGGQFTSARPHLAPAGTGEQPRTNLLAFNLKTGELTDFAPQLNGQVSALDLSPDGKTLYVGGAFTSVNGANFYRAAAFDVATGELKTTFRPSLDASVYAIDSTDDTVYLGGAFSRIGSTPRSKIGSVSAADGKVLPFNPGANHRVRAIAVPADKSKVIVAGHFTMLGGVSGRGTGAVDPTTGAGLPWQVNKVIHSSGDKAAVYSLEISGNNVLASAYNYGSPGNTENVFSARLSDGQFQWANGCLGDTYDVSVMGGVVYSVGHPHNCSQVGGLPQTQPWTFQYVLAQTESVSPYGRKNGGTKIAGLPAAELVHFLPALVPGSFTGMNQAGWSITAKHGFAVVGGEFIKVNGRSQQGITMFAEKGKAPNKMGLQGVNDMNPSAAVNGSTATVSWKAGWDMDNIETRYQIVRDNWILAEVRAEATWWDRPNLSAVIALNGGGANQNLRIRAIDPMGNVAWSSPFQVNAGAAGGTAQPAAPTLSYRTTHPLVDMVRADGATHYWRMGDNTNPVTDQVGGHPLTVSGSSQWGTEGATTDGDKAIRFNGGTVPGTTAFPMKAPTVFTLEGWVKTTTNQGGKLIGFGNSKTGASSSFDRHVYMTNQGSLVFGVYRGQQYTITTPQAFNDGQWHHVAAVKGPDTLTLYVDGVARAQRAGVPMGEDSVGYWRVGGDNLASWPQAPSSNNFAGILDEVATYEVPLTAQQVVAHRDAMRTNAPQTNKAPVAAFTSAVKDLSATVDGSASTDPDGSIASYRWDFGDGTTGTKATEVHAFPRAGTYQVTLTVTDNQGAQSATTRAVTVTAPADPGGNPGGPGGDPGAGQVVAADTFERQATGSWGTAVTGGVWNAIGNTQLLRVANGTGQLQLSVPGQSAGAALTQVQHSNVAISADIALTARPTSRGAYVSVIGRRIDAANDYRVTYRFDENGSVIATLQTRVNGVTTAIAQQVLPGVTYSVGKVLRVEFVINGSPTAGLQARGWLVGQTAPTTWAVSASDAKPALAKAGGVGIDAYLSSGATVSPVTVTVDNLKVTPVA